MAQEVDQVLWELARHLDSVEVKGSFFARLWVGAGLKEAARIVDKKRITILCEGMENNVDEVVQP